MGIRRSNEQKVIAGVCGGIAEAMNIDSTWVRLGFVLFSIFGGSGLLLYGALWAVIPRPEGGTVLQDGIEKGKIWYEDRDRNKRI